MFSKPWKLVYLNQYYKQMHFFSTSRWLWDRKTGMVVQEIGIPSGFQPDLTTLGKVVGMKKSERRGNTVAIYFDEVRHYLFRWIAFYNITDSVQEVYIKQ